MATNDQPHPPPPPNTAAPPGARADEPAEDPRTGVGAELDTLALLDHRTRSHAIRPELAPPGRYLAFDAPGSQLLVALRGTTRIGRGLAADVRIEEHRISPVHALITRQPNGARLLDGRNTNGTLLNGRTVTAGDLHDGDTITLGPARMRYVEVPAIADTDPRARERRYQRALEGWLAGRIRARARKSPRQQGSRGRDCRAARPDPRGGVPPASAYPTGPGAAAGPAPGPLTERSPRRGAQRRNLG